MIFDVGSEVLFERERHDLRELGAAALTGSTGSASNASVPGTSTITLRPAASEAASSGPD